MLSFIGKKVPSVICVGLILSSMSVSAKTFIDIDYDKNIITVSGKSQNQEFVAIEIVKPNIDISKAELNNYDKYNEFFAYVGYVDCDANGDFVSRITLNEKTDRYTLRATEEIPFDYTSKDDVQRILLAINEEKDATVLAANLQKYSKALGVNSYELFDDMTEQNKVDIAKKVVNSTEKFNAEKFKNLVNDNVISTVCSNAVEIEKFKLVLNKFENVTMLDFNNKYYKSLSESKINNVYETMFGERKKINSLNSLNILFEEAVLLESVASVEKKSDVGVILKDYSHLFEDYNSYSQLAEDKKSRVWEVLIDLGKVSFPNFKNVFGKTILEVNTTSSNNNPTWGNGGGGGQTQHITTNIPLSAQEKEIFDDLLDFSWAKESILYLYKKGIVSGVQNNKFNPERSIKREEFVKMICLAFDYNDYRENNQYLDTTKDEWYNKYINAAHNAGIINGIDDENFGVGFNITRQDMAVIIDRCMEKMKINSTKKENIKFTDDEFISDYAKKAVNNLSAIEIINGFSDKTFRPMQNVSRAQAAKVIYMVLMEGATQ